MVFCPTQGYACQPASSCTLFVEELSYMCRCVRSDIRKLGGTRPLAIFYQFSHIRALQALYPQHEWLPWKFVANSRSFFATRENRAIFLRWAGKQLGVCDWTDWYRISTTQVDDLGGESMMNTYYSGSLINALRDCFPVRPRFSAILLRFLA